MRTLKFTVLSCGLLLALPAQAADAPSGGSDSETVQPPKMPLGTGDVRGPGALMVQPSEIHLPAAGQSTSEDFTFDYHGYFRMPLSIGINSRLNPAPDQSKMVYHAPAVVPDNVEGTWLWSNNVPNAWANLQLSYGNKYVTGIIGIAGWKFAGSPNNAAATGNAYVSMGPVLVHIQNPEIFGSKIGLDWDVGAFGNRYGYAGRFDYGQYGMFVIGATGVIGETLGLQTEIADGHTVRIEHGVGSNAYVNDQTLGSTLLHHAHAFYGYKENFKIGVHYMTAWTTDERPARYTTPQMVDTSSGTVTQYNGFQYGYNGQTQAIVPTVDSTIPEGRETIVGADMRINAGAFGSLYIGGSIITASHADVLSPVIYVLNAVGGRGLRDNFLGGDGTGTIKSVLAQYDFSFVTLARYLAHYPPRYWTNGPDLTLSLFGTVSTISVDPYVVPAGDGTNTTGYRDSSGTWATDAVTVKSPFDGTKKVKWGGELIYSALPYLSFGARYDNVVPWSNIDRSVLAELPAGQSFQVISPKIQLKTSFWSREAITLQWSHYMYGDNAARLADASNRGRNTFQNTSLIMPQLATGALQVLTDAPYDKDLIYLSGTMWW